MIVCLQGAVAYMSKNKEQTKDFSNNGSLQDYLACLLSP